MDEINKYEIFKQLNLNQDFVEKIKLLHFFDSKNLIIVTNDDETFVFGGNSFGVLGFGHEDEVIKLTLNENLRKKQIVDFKNGRYYAIARTIDGKVYCWGWSFLGQLGNETNDDKIYKAELNQKLNDKNIVDICCGSRHSLVLTNEGQVYAWGCNDHGQIENRNIPYNALIPYHVNRFNGEKVKAIACGARHSLALTEKGHVFGWGRNNFGQLGLEKLNILDSRNASKLIGIDEVFKKISCGRSHSLLLSHDGDIYVFGWNKYGQLGNETIKEQSETPLKLRSEKKFIDIASHWRCNISMALSNDGTIYIWGQCGKEVIKTPRETQFKSFNEVLVNYFQSAEVFTSKYSSRLAAKIRLSLLSLRASVFDISTYVMETVIKTVMETVMNISPPNRALPPRERISFCHSKFKIEFDVLVEIGSGSYGNVFKVKHKSTQEIFAIKKILVKDENDSLKELVASLHIKELDNPLTVKYHDIWVEEELIAKSSEQEKTFNSIIYIQMDLCEKSLGDIIKEIKDINLTEDGCLTLLGYYTASELFNGVLEGVQYLHDTKPPLIHRDLKPDNVLLKIEPYNKVCVKIADFGLAVIHEKVGELHTADRGHISYAAPEVLDGKVKCKYDTKADIYSLGVIAKELFFIDTSRDYQKSQSLLVNKYEALSSLYEKMTSNLTRTRPNCEDILKDKHSWGLSANEFSAEKEYKYFEKSNKYLYLTKLIKNFLQPDAGSVLDSDFSSEMKYDSVTDSD